MLVFGKKIMYAQVPRLQARQAYVCRKGFGFWSEFELSHMYLPLSVRISVQFPLKMLMLFGVWSYHGQVNVHTFI